MKHALYLAVASVTLGAIVGQNATAGEWTIDRSVTVSESFTDNVDGDPDGQEESAVVTQISPGLSIRGSGGRLSLSLDAFPTLRHQTSGDDKGANFDSNLAGFATLEMLPERLFIDAAAAQSRQLFDTREADALSNQDTVQTYRVSPYVRQHIRGFADAELRYSLDQVIVDSDVASDSTSHNLSFSLDSGRNFSRLTWTLGVSATEEARSDDDDLSRRDVNLDLEYVVASYLSLLGGAGYQEFDDGDPSNEINSATWRAGFRWRPGSRTELRATYGERDDEESLDLSFRYDISARTRLTASYNERLETSQDRLSQTLSFIGTDPNTGQLIDTRTGLPFDPNASNLRIRDVTTRTETLSLGISGSRGRNTFSLLGSIEDEEIEPSGDGDDSISIVVSWGRQLNRLLTMTLTGNYERSDFGGENRQDEEYGLSGGLNYSIFSNLTGGLSYSFQTRKSDISSDEFTENQLGLTLRMLF